MNKENIKNHVNVKDSVPQISNAKHNSNEVQIEPIENYKGKSVEELEAILDAYNNSKKPSGPTIPPKEVEASKPPAPLPKR